MSAYRQTFQQAVLPLLAACCPMGSRYRSFIAKTSTSRVWDGF